MSEQWETTTADSVAVGDQVRLRGIEITVARVDPTFLGRPGMIAFIEDTPDRWLKVPPPADSEVEIRRAD